MRTRGNDKAEAKRGRRKILAGRNFASGRTRNAAKRSARVVARWIRFTSPFQMSRKLAFATSHAYLHQASSERGQRERGSDNETTAADEDSRRFEVLRNKVYNDARCTMMSALCLLLAPCGATRVDVFICPNSCH